MGRSSHRWNLDAPAGAGDEGQDPLAGLAIEREHALAAYRPVGLHRIHELADAIGRAIETCRSGGLTGLMVDLRGLDNLPATTSVDRFLMVEEWAAFAHGQVAIAFVIVQPIVSPPSFVRRAAVEFGLPAEMFAGEREARAWLAGFRRS
jgi:hypothetical protein